MSTPEHSWAVMGIKEQLRVCCSECSWVLTLPQRHAHECTWLIAYDWIWVLKSAHDRSLVLMIVLGIMAPCSCVFMTAHGHSEVLMSTYEQPWALMSIAPWCQENSRAPRAFMSMVPWHHEHSWGVILSRHHTHQCFLVLGSAQEYSGVFMGAPNWSWVLKCLI